jgi:hypothetical protein
MLISLAARSCHSISLPARDLQRAIPSLHFNLNWRERRQKSFTRASKWILEKATSEKFVFRGNFESVKRRKIIILSSTLNPRQRVSAENPFALLSRLFFARDNEGNKMPNFITTATVTNRKRYILWFITLLCLLTFPGP